MKRFIVIALEKACTVRDMLPGTCKHRLAYWSGQLDGRWNTGVWDHII